MALSRWGIHPLSAKVKDGSHLRPSKTVRVTATEVTLLERARWMTNERDWSFQWCSSSENNPHFWETHILGLCKKSMSRSILTGGRDKWDRRFCGNHSLLICPPPFPSMTEAALTTPMVWEKQKISDDTRTLRTYMCNVHTCVLWGSLCPQSTGLVAQHHWS